MDPKILRSKDQRIKGSKDQGIKGSKDQRIKGAFLSEPKRYTITSALPYANGPLHLGHLAGAYLPGDIYARYCRLKGRDTLYVCGSDEHGVAILIRALKDGVTPRDIVDRYHPLIEESFRKLGMSFDYYGRTSSDVHKNTSQDFFRTIAGKHFFEEKTEEQLFDPEAGIFLADRFVMGTCPICGYEDAYGDQCEKCGSSLSPRDLKNPRSAISNAIPILKETTHWYFPLDKVQKDLEEWIASHPEWRTHVLGQINSWFNAGLRARSITRDLPWGVPVPGDTPQTEGKEVDGKVLYVWFDAPIGYISASKEWAIAKGDPDAWEPYWKDEESRLVHFIGKDNIVFHCLIFPGMLMTHGEFVLPYNVPANEFLNLEGNKFSTSRNYAVWLHDYLERFDPDPLRYTLTSNMPETRDADFSWSDFQARHNNELADILGNFVNRTFTFVHKYYEGKVPPAGPTDALDRELVDLIRATGERVGEAVDAFQFKESQKRFLELARFANKYFNDKEPWKSRKDNPEGCATTLHFCLQTIYALAIYMNPFLPFSSAKVWEMLNLKGKPEGAGWDGITGANLAVGHQLGEAEILFRKIEDEVIQVESENLAKIQAGMAAAKAEKENAEPPLPQISFEDFKKADLRTAVVIAAERIPKAKKLFLLKVDLGAEQRQIVSGLAGSYEPEDLVGKTVVVVANLKPAVIRGVESRGMLLAVEDNGRLIIVTADGDVAPGRPVA